MAHKELFIQQDDIEKLILRLKEKGYQFQLPQHVSKDDPPTCSFTFDDGYYNNTFFLELATKHNIPFILFLNSFNIIHELPFIWDIWEATTSATWKMSAFHYEELYKRLTSEEKGLLKNENHRPFTSDELMSFSSHPLSHLSLHTHTHQPLVGKYLKRMDAELTLNAHFLQNYQKFLPTDFSLPCGFYTNFTLKKLLKKFDRIYTAEGGGFKALDRVVHRISLINPAIGGDLMAQIERSFLWERRLKRRLTTFRYSNYVLSQY